MSVITTPVIPPQPNTPYYTGSALNILPEYTRISYRAAQGIDAPAGDITKRPKFWADSTVGSAALINVTYPYFDTITSPPSVKQMTMSQFEASQFNIPGLPSFPQYVVTETSATSLGAPLNKNSLSTLQQAQQLALSWGLDPTHAVAENLGTYSWPDNESRRVYEIMYNGTQYNVGGLLLNMNNFGVGAPGMWVLGAAGGPQWILSPPPNQNFTALAWPDPIRGLLANEGLANGGGALGGQTVIVYNTTMNSPYNPNTNASTSIGTNNATSGLTAAQDARLIHIENTLNAVAKAFGVMVPS